MTKVYVIASGCVYEGGSVRHVFVRKDLAEAKFAEEIAEKRRHMVDMEEFAIKQEEEFRRDVPDLAEYTYTRGEWLGEELEEDENKKLMIFHGMDYISLRIYDCEDEVANVA